MLKSELASSFLPSPILIEQTVDIEPISMFKASTIINSGKQIDKAASAYCPKYLEINKPSSKVDKKDTTRRVNTGKDTNFNNSSKEKSFPIVVVLDISPIITKN